MKTNNTMALLRAMLKSTSVFNIYKHCNDKKKRGKIIGAEIGYMIIFVFIIGICIAQSYGLAKFGLADSLPALTATSVASMAFILCIFRANGYLFQFKEYDMLISMPFKISQIVECKLICMYVKTLPWFFSISVAMMIGYGIGVSPAIWVYPVWIILSAVVPLIPMVLSCAIGYVVAWAGSKFKYKKAVQTILMFVFIFLAFFSRFFIEAIAKNEDVRVLLEKIADLTGTAKKGLFFVAWFDDAITKGNILSMLLLIAVSAAVFVAFYLLIAKSYTRINSRLAAHAAKSTYKMSTLKKNSVVKAVAFKELRRMLGSTNYLVNAGFGQVFIVIATVAMLFVEPERIIVMFTNGIPVPKEILLPAVVMSIYLFLGMVPSTCCSPSLEGKNYWIVQSLPIKKMDLYKGKMLFNIFLTVPLAIISSIVFGIRFGGDVIDIVLFVIEAIALCCFSTTFGMVCGLKFMKLDWTNEIEVIKQSAAVSLYLLPNMIFTLAGLIGGVALGTKIGTKPVVLIITATAVVLTAISILIINSFANKKGAY